MPGLGPHAFFIAAAWVFGLGIVAALVAWVTLDHRAQRRTLTRLEQEGHGRPGRRTST